MSRAREISKITDDLHDLWDQKNYEDLVNILAGQHNSLEGALLGIGLANRIGESACYKLIRLIDARLEGKNA